MLPVDDEQGLDIGPKTIELFTREIRTAKTVFWNGPVGMFEKAEYATGTIASRASDGREQAALRSSAAAIPFSAVNAAGVADKNRLHLDGRRREPRVSRGRRPARHRNSRYRAAIGVSVDLETDGADVSAARARGSSPETGR